MPFFAGEDVVANSIERNRHNASASDSIIALEPELKVKRANADLLELLSNEPIEIQFFRDRTHVISV